jgi:hypothetical protein
MGMKATKFKQDTRIANKLTFQEVTEILTDSTIQMSANIR